MTAHGLERNVTRREAAGMLAAAGLGMGSWSRRTAAADPAPSEKELPLLIGLDDWSLSFSRGVRREFKPARPLTAWDILAKVRQWGLKGAQTETPIPKLGSKDFEAFRKAVLDAGLYWEVAAGDVADQPRVLQAMEGSAALGSKVVRAFMDGFGLQFRLQGAALDQHVAKAMSHLEKLLPKFEQAGMHLCIENHSGLRSRHLRRVLDAFPTKHLGVNLDTGNAVLTLEDPIAIAERFAPRAYTVHLKDWNLIRNDAGVLVRGCALGEGVVDLKAIVAILRAKAPREYPLHLNIETTQEYLPLGLFTAEFWRWHGEVSGGDLGNLLRLTEKRDMPPGDYRIAATRGEPEATVLAEEQDAVTRSAAYCRDVLRLL